MVHIYNNILEYIIGLNYDYEDFKKNPILYYPDWNTSYYATTNKYDYPIVDDDNIIREMTREEKILKLGMEELLEDGEYIQDGKLIVVKYDEKLGYLKRTWNKETHIWYEGATEEEITEHMGVLVTKLLYDVMAIGCEVTIQEEKHQQSLDDDKRKALNERISGFDLAQELGTPISQVAWSFRDDGTDTVVMSVDEFKQMTLYCLGYGEKCYLAAELLKAKRKVNSTIDDFYNELKNVGEISLANL
ncbi:hypothetical protein DW663_07080 [Fusobacterium mortiferum]|uniref:DUF4376 domain-containing protein n=1 Tax=Fusobacterium mortiferum TaxID=850 RepID=A0A414PUT6_FUSMR|nr:hypothetical protein [Fusobacterium mortiferum]RHF72338.1 hypothetical protein DW663_07080 [Fusobacterium mortiferum]